MPSCEGCKERDLRIQQLCMEVDRIEAERDDYRRGVHRMRREAENP